MPLCVRRAHAPLVARPPPCRRPAPACPSPVVARRRRLHTAARASGPLGMRRMPALFTAAGSTPQTRAASAAVPPRTTG
eukprot:scaffold69585_cov63-Phaeocystis_antarctica.AAC.2